MGYLYYMSVFWVGYIKGTTRRMYGIKGKVPTYITVVAENFSYRSAKLWASGTRS